MIYKPQGSLQGYLDLTGLWFLKRKKKLIDIGFSLLQDFGFSPVVSRGGFFGLDIGLSINFRNKANHRWPFPPEQIC
jgi:hypothetical protein